MITPGTICFIIKAAPANAQMIGRVVEVTGAALPVPERSGLIMHKIDAAWLREEKPRHVCYACPEYLLPIAGPHWPVSARRLRELQSQ